MKLLTKEKLQYWGHSLLHPFDGFFEIRFRNHGSLLIATLLLIAYGILRCLSEIGCDLQTVLGSNDLSDFFLCFKLFQKKRSDAVIRRNREIEMLLDIIKADNP